ncbi:hypothetical protein [Rhodococcus sp. BS-15]|uniref:hypothetical protein n=1 Tax=Rhodococcus sp. BS-15 TaxID=1304954 RepID=UPI0035B516A1
MRAIPAAAAIAPITTAMPTNSASLSEVPNVSMAHSRIGAGLWSTAEDPTAVSGDELGPMGTAINSPTPRTTPAATMPDSARFPVLTRSNVSESVVRGSS